jgi:S1-C subfamily serine protease
MKLLIGALLFAMAITAPALAAENQRRTQGPDSLILQGPGSDIRATVGVLPESRRPQGLAGVIIEQVTRDGPADAAAVRRGDIVTEFDDIAITDPVQFNKVVRDTPPGRRVKAIVWRDGVRREVFIAPVAGTLQ